MFFADELKKMHLERVLSNGKYIGRKFYGFLNTHLRAEVGFCLAGNPNGKYNAICVKVFHIEHGPVNEATFRLLELSETAFGRTEKDLGTKVRPYICELVSGDVRTFGWMLYEPTESDYEAAYEAVRDYLSLF